MQDEEYLDETDFDEIFRLRRNDVNYYDILRKIGEFDNNVNIPQHKQNVNSWIERDPKAVQDYVRNSHILKKKGKAVPVRNNRPNYRKNIPRIRVRGKSPYAKRRIKRQFEETDFLTYWADLFNFANLGPGSYFSDSSYSSSSAPNLLGVLAVTGALGGAMMAGNPTMNFQVCC